MKTKTQFLIAICTLTFATLAGCGGNGGTEPSAAAGNGGSSQNLLEGRWSGGFDGTGPGSIDLTVAADGSIAGTALFATTHDRGTLTGQIGENGAVTLTLEIAGLRPMAGRGRIALSRDGSRLDGRLSFEDRNMSFSLHSRTYRLPVGDWTGSVGGTDSGIINFTVSDDGDVLGTARFAGINNAGRLSGHVGEEGELTIDYTPRGAAPERGTGQMGLTIDGSRLNGHIDFPNRRMRFSMQSS